MCVSASANEFVMNLIFTQMRLSGDQFASVVDRECTHLSNRSFAPKRYLCYFSVDFYIALLFVLNNREDIEFYQRRQFHLFHNH